MNRPAVITFALTLTLLPAAVLPAAVRPVPASTWSLTGEPIAVTVEYRGPLVTGAWVDVQAPEGVQEFLCSPAVLKRCAPGSDGSMQFLRCDVVAEPLGGGSIRYTCPRLGRRPLPLCLSASGYLAPSPIGGPSVPVADRFVLALAPCGQ